jgi:putative Holliday junction resolvase
VRILGVDHGAARTGLALSDPVGLTCRPLLVVRERDPEALVARVLTVAAEEEVTEIVVGLPRPLAGGRNDQLDQAEAFAGRLRAASPIPVLTWDERFTTKLAERGRKKTTPADAVAACHLLQNFLDARYLAAAAAREEDPGETGP